MKRKILLLTLSVFHFLSSHAQGIYGNSNYFEFTYNKVTDWSAFAGAATFNATIDGELIQFGNCNNTGSSRSKGGYLGAVRCQSIELPEFASLGYLSLYLQNGSSGTDRNLYVKVWDDNSSTWVTTETITVGGNQDLRISPSSCLSKKAVKVKIDSDGTYFWFHQVEAWSSTLETANINEAPAILSITPTGGSVIPTVGSIEIQFDEMIKSGTGAIPFSGGTTTPSILGNTLLIDYSGLTNPTNTLTIPSTYILNKTDVTMVKDTSINYDIDLSDPVLQTISPSDGSFIVINDILEKIEITFDEDITLGTGTITFGPATVTPSVSGQTLVISYSDLAYSTPYTLTIPANMISDISGNTYKTDISINYTTYPPDNTAPLLISQSISNGATNVSIGGSIYFTFNEIVEQSGNVTINGNTVTASINGSLLGINYTNLDYNTLYTIDIPAGSVTDTTGNPYAGSTFQFTTKSFSSTDFDIIVAQDGSGDYTTINAAIAAVPDNSSERTYIFVKSGTYTEKIRIETNKQNISLIGQDSSNTIITYNDGAVTAGGTDASYTINVRSTGFYAENLKIKNTYGQGSQAVALMTEGDKQVYKNCRLYGFQDTHYPKRPDTRNYYLNCYIEGATDFMFGSGTCFFEGCTINCVNGGQYITAPSGTSKEFGLVYNNCIINANADVAINKFYLGRPWKDDAKTVWLNTKLDNVKLKPEGWAVWATSGADADNHLTGFFAEYNTMDLSGAPYNPTRAAWGVILTPSEADHYTIDNVFNFGTGSDTWNPLPFSTETNAPENLIVTGNNLTWDAPDFATGYIIFRNGLFITSTTNTFYTDVSGTSSDNYQVKAINEYGAQSASASWPLTGLKKSKNKNAAILYPNPFNAVLHVKSEYPINRIEFYNSYGQLVKQTSEYLVSTSDLKEGLYSVKVVFSNGEEELIKIIKQ